MLFETNYLLNLNL